MKSSIQKRIAIVAEALSKVAEDKASYPSLKDVLRVSNSIKVILNKLVSESYTSKSELQSLLIRLGELVATLHTLANLKAKA